MGHFGQLSKALGMFQEIEMLARELGKQEDVANALSGQANIYAEHGGTSKALALLKEVEMIARELGDRGKITASLNDQGKVYQKRGEQPKALVSYKEAEILARELGDQKELFTSLNNQAAMYTEQGNIPQALKLLKEAVSALRETSNDSNSISLGLKNIVHLYEELKDWEKALDSLNKLESFCKQQKNNREGLNWCLQRRLFLKQQIYSEKPKAERNDPCPCGSGKKYKNCCGK